MKSAILALLCALAMSVPARADSTPQAFLAAILQHDFDGDGAFRVGKAIFIGGKSARVGDPCCSEPREVFDATGDPIELVAKWELTTAGQVTRDEAALPVRFVAVAETIGSGNSEHHARQVKPLAAPRDVTVIYHLRHRGSEWLLVNPPLPRVGLFALIRILRNDVQRTEDIIKTEAADPAGVQFHERMIATRRSRIKELEDIAVKMSLSTEAKADEPR